MPRIPLFFSAVLCVDGLVIDGGGGGIARQELIAEGVDQLLVSVHREHALPDCDDDQLIREAAHPALGLNGRAQVVREPGDVVRVGDMERAAGEGVHIHHVNERGGAVDERSVVRREGEQIAEAVGIAHVEAAGRAVYGVLGIPSGGRELFFIAVCIPDRVEDRQRVVDSRGGLVLCRGLGLGRLGRRLCARSLRRLFSRLGLGLLLGLPGRLLFRLPGRPLLGLAVRRLLLCWLRLLGLLRLLLPNVLLPATTALGTLDASGRQQGVLSGCNVVMPNLSPQDVRKKYMLYDNKICTGDEAAECVKCLSNRIASTGYELVCDRGDYK